MAEDEAVRSLSDAVQAIVRNKPDVQFALNGILIIETIDTGEASPVLHQYDIGDPTPWLKVGMLSAALINTKQEVRDGYRPGED